jgi:lipopolysaccharide export system permease protein
MRLVDRYIVRQIGESYVLGVGLFTSLLLVTHLFTLARLAADIPVSLGTNLALLVLRVPYFVTFSLPFATLFAVLLAFGRLSDGNEITAMRTSGWSLARVAAPVLLTGVAIMLLSLALGEWVVPHTEARYRSLFSEVVRPDRPPEVQYHVLFRELVDGADSVFYAQELSGADGTMKRVVIVQLQQERPVRLIEADVARYGPQGWVLNRGRLYLLGAGGSIASDFEEWRIVLPRTPRQIIALRREPIEMTIRELRGQIARLRATGESAVRYAVALQAKLALPASSAIFALLAVPLGLRPHRSGRSIGFGLTVVVLVAYWFLMSVTLTLGERGQLSAFLAAWSPNMVVATAGGYMLWRSI